MTAELHAQIANRETMIKRLGGEVLEMRRLEADASDRNIKLEQMIHGYGWPNPIARRKMAPSCAGHRHSMSHKAGRGWHRRTVELEPPLGVGIARGP